MSVAIAVENLSKAYQLGQIGTGTISRDLERWFAGVRGKEDPFLKIGETNDRTTKGVADFVWSLKDLNFQIRQGDAVGIIGRNGAGKSTLLKLLSRVTSPTIGNIKIKGRVASLLEVGTGFHPELTGRENIFLNGAILGMRKKEIASKFDEIVDFAGVERYIDTPVKRYSSGMYVRLAFAVAAHLESEILIVDEVLAVGDAEFQQKCLGKMGSVTKGEGRTVLFVSHNMASISTLCSSTIILEKGQLLFEGTAKDGINKYIGLSRDHGETVELSGVQHHKCDFSRLLSVAIQDENGNAARTYFIGGKLRLAIEFEMKEDVRNLELGFCFNNMQDITLGACVSPWENFQKSFSKGIHRVTCEVDELMLLPATYSITIWIKRIGEMIDDQVERVVEFEILSRDLKNSHPYFEKYVELNTYIPSSWTK